MKSEHDDVLIVVPCLNEAPHLVGLLDFLLETANGARIVVADGGSTDGSLAIIKRFVAEYENVILMHNLQVIQSAGINLAVRRYGRGAKWLLRVDAHAQYPADFLDILLDTAAAKEATSVVVPMITKGREGFQKAVAAAQNSVLGTGGAVHRHISEGQWVEHGHHALLDLALFMAVGGYDENFSANEDAELDHRLVLAGARIWLEPSASIAYFPRTTVKGLYCQYLKYGQGRARNLKRHGQSLKVRQLLPLAVAPALFFASVGMGLFPFVEGAAMLALPVFCWLAGAVFAGLCLGFKNQSCWSAVAGVAAIIMHAAWSIGFIQEALSFRLSPPTPRSMQFEITDVVDYAQMRIGSVTTIGVGSIW